MAYSSATGSTRRAHPPMVVPTLVVRPLIGLLALALGALAATACLPPPSKTRPVTTTIAPEVLQRARDAVTGSWHGGLVIGATEDIALTFAADGTLTAVTDQVPFTGIWTVMTGSTFTFAAAGPGRLPGGGTGRVELTMAATLGADGTTFTATGTLKVVLDNGQVLDFVPPTLTATKDA
jgi:hypothetical protein